MATCPVNGGHSMVVYCTGDSTPVYISQSPEGPAPITVNVVTEGTRPVTRWTNIVCLLSPTGVWNRCMSDTSSRVLKQGHTFKNPSTLLDPKVIPFKPWLALPILGARRTKSQAMAAEAERSRAPGPQGGHQVGNIEYSNRQVAGVFGGSHSSGKVYRCCERGKAFAG